MDGDEALEADGDRHEDGCHEGNLVEGVQEVREQDYVQPERVRGQFLKSSNHVDSLASLGFILGYYATSSQGIMGLKQPTGSFKPILSWNQIR